MPNDLINPKLFNVQPKIINKQLINKQHIEIKQSVYHAIDKIKSMTSKEFPFAIIFTTDDGESLSSKYNPDELSSFSFFFQEYLESSRNGKKALDDFLQSLDSFSSEYKTLAKCDTDSPQFKKNQQELKEKLKSLCSHLNNANFMVNKMFYILKTSETLLMENKEVKDFYNIRDQFFWYEGQYNDTVIQVVSTECKTNDDIDNVISRMLSNLHHEQTWNLDNFNQERINRLSSIIEGEQLSPIIEDAKISSIIGDAEVSPIVEDAEVSLLHASSSGICKPCCCSIL